MGEGQRKESAAYQEHFDDLCRLLGQPTPNEADPSGRIFSAFKSAWSKMRSFSSCTKHPMPASRPNAALPTCGKKAVSPGNTRARRKTSTRLTSNFSATAKRCSIRRLLVVCDFDRYIIRTNFNGTVQEVHEFTNDQIDRPENLRHSPRAFQDPDYLKPQRTTAQVTETLAEKFAKVARSLQKRESAELADARTRAEVNVAQKKNLRIARFLNRLVFCFFAEDTGLLPKNLFSEIAKIGLEDPAPFRRNAANRSSASWPRAGMFGKDKIRHFNGHLFEDSTVFELTEDEIAACWPRRPRRTGNSSSRASWARSSTAAWTPSQRAATWARNTPAESRHRDAGGAGPHGAAPPRMGRSSKPNSAAAACSSTAKAQPRRSRPHRGLPQRNFRQSSVLDPACGSGNFLYVSLQLLLRPGKGSHHLRHATWLQIHAAGRRATTPRH